MARLKDKGRMAAVIALAMILLVSTMVFAAGPGGGMGGGRGGPGSPGGMQGGGVEMSKSVINVRLTTPVIGSLSRETEFIGKIEPSKTVNIYPETSGKVVQLHAEAGDSVKAGQLLLSLDDTDAQLSYQMAQTSYERTAVSVDTTLGSSYESKINSAKSQLDNAQQALSNARLKLKDYNDGYDDDLVNAEKSLERARQKVSSLNAKLADAKANNADREEISDLNNQLSEAENEYRALSVEIGELEDSEDSGARDLRSAYRNAQTSYESALANYELVLGNSYTDAQAAAEVDLKSAALSLQQSANTLDKYKVYSPIDGVIESRSAELYETVGSQSPVFTISNKESLSVTFNASADGAAALAAGDTVTVNKGGRDYPATVTEVESKASDTTGLFPVKATLDETDESLLTGVSVKVTAATAKAENALLVDIDNVYYDADGQPYVFTYADGKAHRTDFVAGMSSSEQVVAESGLTLNSQIITTWHPDLADGAEVTLMDGEAAPASAPPAKPEESPAQRDEASGQETDSPEEQADEQTAGTQPAAEPSSSEPEQAPASEPEQVPEQVVSSEPEPDSDPAEAAPSDDSEASSAAAAPEPKRVQRMQPKD